MNIAIGLNFNAKFCQTWSETYKSFFGSKCSKSYVKDRLEIETKHSIKLNKTMIFNKEDKLYLEANNACHIFSKACANKVKDHCHETGKNRNSACNIYNKNYRQQNVIHPIFHNGKGYDFSLLFSELFEHNGPKRRVDVLLSTNGKLECLE